MVTSNMFQLQKDSNNRDLKKREATVYIIAWTKCETSLKSNLIIQMPLCIL